MKELRKIFDAWAGDARKRYDERQWILSKWENFEGVQWSPEKISQLVGHIRDGLQFPSRGTFLDAGCGGGWILGALNDGKMRFTGLDISEKMLQAAHRSLQNSHLTCGEIAKLPFRSESFDRVLCYFVIINFKDIDYLRQSILEIARVLRKGGRALIGQIPDQTKSADYDRDKAAYLGYCRKTFKLGVHIRDQHVIPVNVFSREQLLGFVRETGVPFEVRPSFNPFYRPGSAKTVDWRFDIILNKPGENEK